MSDNEGTFVSDNEGKRKNGVVHCVKRLRVKVELELGWIRVFSV
jgi:hypothetical protein